MKIEHDEIVGQIFSLMNMILFIEKKNVFESDKIKLYPREIHLLLFLIEKQNVNATQIAEKMFITKGAISQTLTRLEKKGMVEKIKDPYNKNELTINLTKEGRKVVKEFMKTSNTLKYELDSYLGGLSDSDKLTIDNFITFMKEMLKKVH
jgi:DNA-binding MarR family transcriptional regulator